MKAHAKSLCRLIQYQFGYWRDIRGAEVGVWRGQLSRELLSSFPRLHLYMVDPWEDSDENPTMVRGLEALVSARQEAEQATNAYRCRRTIYQMTSIEAADDLIGTSIGTSLDFVFIDAIHTYNAVREDLEAWFPLLSADGILCGHDYKTGGDRKGWGVKRAVDEFAAANDLIVEVMPGLVWRLKEKVNDGGKAERPEHGGDGVEVRGDATVT